jgi:hypothetical protein
MIFQGSASRPCNAKIFKVWTREKLHHFQKNKPMVSLGQASHELWRGVGLNVWKRGCGCVFKLFFIIIKI